MAIRHKLHFTRGFTLVELVVVMVVLGILAAVAIPAFFDLDTYKERAAYDEVASALRYAQKLAVASGHDLKVVFDSDENEYQIQQCNNKNFPHCDCGDPDVCKWTNLSKDYPVTNGPDKKSKVELSGPVLVFDAMGRLIDEATLAPLQGDFEVNVGEAVPLMKIEIHAETGYVDARYEN